MDRAYRFQAKYEALQDELAQVEKMTGIYLRDKNVDEENVLEDKSIHRYSADYWAAMIASASMAAGERGREAGIDINSILGRVIY